MYENLTSNRFKTTNLKKVLENNSRELTSSQGISRSIQLNSTGDSKLLDRNDDRKMNSG